MPGKHVGRIKIMLGTLVSENDNVQFKDRNDFLHWLIKQHGRTRHVESEGVLMEFGTGDLHAVPFEAFAAKGQAVLKGGFDNWKKHHDDEEAKSRETLHLQAEAAAYQREVEQQCRIAMMNLRVQQYDSGLFDLWRVELIPRNGGRSQWVIVPARNSGAAAATAIDQRHAGHRSNAGLPKRAP